MAPASNGASSEARAFSVRCPVHGMISLPALLRRFIDHRWFQRLRHIRQLSMASHVFPGATHTRFVHSIGTAYLSYELVRHVQRRQPELEIEEKDVLCVALAGLLHDIGHPGFSHMFEKFVHAAASDGSLTEEQRGRHLQWEHEHASIAFVRQLWREPEMQAALGAAGLGDQELEFVCALIHPPKKQLLDALGRGCLGGEWASLVPFLPREKSWMFEIVSNWRCGLDADRFDYFRRDAHALGIKKEFDHGRYMSSVRVVFDAAGGIWTLSPPDKDRDTIRDDMFELRRSLHRTAYQHKTVQKIEKHMIDILLSMERCGFTVVGKDGARVKMSRAAVDFDPVAYSQLLDSLVEQRLVEVQEPGAPLSQACRDYEQRVLRRNLFRLVADFDVPSNMDFAGQEGKIIARMLKVYASLHEHNKMRDLLQEFRGSGANADSFTEIQALGCSMFRCNVAEFHQGSGREDPLRRVVFHSSKDPSRVGTLLRGEQEAPPLSQKVFVFFDAGTERQEIKSARADGLMRQLTAVLNKHVFVEIDEELQRERMAAAPRACATPLQAQRASVEPSNLEHTPSTRGPRSPSRKRRRMLTAHNSLD